MDRGKRATNLFGNKNCKIYMGLKDIIRENALAHLPAKSLFRCNGVCRDWKLQISTPFFAHNQSNCFQSTSGFFYQTTSGEPSFMSVDPKAYGVPDPSLSFLPEPVDVRSSSNGLLCCQGRTGYRAYYVCNPVTKQWKKLPKPDNDHGADPAVVLVFEPSLLNFIAEFKLVCAFKSELDGLEFDIYCSQKGSWRTSGEICFANITLSPKSGVYVNGTVYWRSGYGFTSFDLKSERCQFQSQYYASGGVLGSMNGKLCVADLRGNRLSFSVLSNTHSNTMQLKSNAKPWDQIQHDNITDVMGVDNTWKYNGCIKHIGGDIVLIQNGSTYSSYDMKKKTATTLGEFNVASNSAIVGYVNSLVEL
ncbi:hypothetical protein CCACVL1_26197 [Corchorus capsularis]|uniref:F-box protein At3g26010-like beta-propeller domain-containing protein n=1 Tax=Corchorus capsularis TaxID=210143 RepID=A0A1R3GFP6_COCAP|nr:hypothetical protein CCACVL1_26197 [Corchorus capsularis]